MSNIKNEETGQKLSSPKYNLGFIAATLGSSKNKKLFVEHQDATYPDLLKYGVTDWSLYKQDISKIITTFQVMYYRAKQAELSAL